jgi:TM2 domain-containing membrane protein YozV
VLLKNRTIAALLGIFLGSLGAHKFYLGRPIQGLLYLLLFWTLIPGIVGIVEGLALLVGTDEAFNVRFNKGTPAPHSQSTTPAVSELIEPVPKGQDADSGSSLMESEDEEGASGAALQASDAAISTENASDVPKEAEETKEEDETKPGPSEALSTYTVVYLGGLPGLPKPKAAGIKLHILDDSFVLKPTMASKKWFAEMSIKACRETGRQHSAKFPGGGRREPLAA